jgi:hypothetical protein
VKGTYIKTMRTLSAFAWSKSNPAPRTSEIKRR